MTYIFRCSADLKGAYNDAVPAAMLEVPDTYIKLLDHFNRRHGK